MAGACKLIRNRTSNGVRLSTGDVSGIRIECFACDTPDGFASCAQMRGASVSAGESIGATVTNLATSNTSERDRGGSRWPETGSRGPTEDGQEGAVPRRGGIRPGLDRVVAAPSGDRWDLAVRAPEERAESVPYYTMCGGGHQA